VLYNANQNEKIKQ
jgi:hypothetical protein